MTIIISPHGSVPTQLYLLMTMQIYLASVNSVDYDCALCHSKSTHVPPQRSHVTKAQMAREQPAHSCISCTVVIN